MGTISNNRSPLSVEEQFKVANDLICNVNASAPYSESQNKAVEIMIGHISTLNHTVQAGDWVLNRLLRKILQFFGVITKFQTLANKLAEINVLAATTLDELKKKEELSSQKKIEQKNIADGAKEISNDLGVVGKKILELKENVRASLSNSDRQVLGQARQNANDYQQFFTDTKAPLSELFKLYQGDIEEFQGIADLSTHYEMAKDELKEILNLLNGHPHVEQPKTVNEIRPGGIWNGGNTCYLASLFQSLNNTEPYRRLCDPKLHPLSPLANESTAAFEQRKLLQQGAFDIAEQVEKGISVSGREVNAFREACYNFEYEPGKRVIGSLRGQEDSLEVLNKLLLYVLNYEPQNLTFKKVVESQDDTQYEVVSHNWKGEPLDPKEYQFLNEATYIEKGKGCLFLSPLPYLGQEVSMQTLMEDFTKPETIEGIYKHRDPLSGNVSFRKYENLQKSYELDCNSTFPEVLQVTINQLDGEHISIAQPKVLYPSGKLGVGPKYKLTSVIVHQPGHYVAYVVTKSGITLANDGLVSTGKSSTIPGRGYLYVLDKTFDEPLQEEPHPGDVPSR